MHTVTPENPLTFPFEIIDALVMIRAMGTDQVFLSTKFPSPYPPEVDPNPLTIKFDTRRGTGVEYVRTTFGIEPRVIHSGG